MTKPKFHDPHTWPADYAPGLNHPKGRTPAWQAPQRYVKAGWAPARIPIPEGDVTALCRRYTRDLLAWWAKREVSAADFGTWGYVIRRYRSDSTSPYAEVKQNTRDGYDYTCDAWDRIIGHMRIENLTFEQIKQIELAMRNKGRSSAYIRRMMTQLRGLANYGSLLREIKDPCRDVADTLSKMRFKMPAAKSTYPTREEVMAIVEQADAHGDHLIATGWLLQFEMCLRAVDVRGQWLSIQGTPLGAASRQGSAVHVVQGREVQSGGITRNGRRWQDGLTWEMFSPDMTRFQKVISKTERTMPEPYVFDLGAVPYLRERIARARHVEAVGPVFVTRAGLPYDQTTWARVWAKYRGLAGVSEEVKVTDLRSGGITEARNMGAGAFDLRDAAQHSNVSTTSRYVRGRSEASRKVINLRQRGGKDLN